MSDASIAKAKRPPHLSLGDGAIGEARSAAEPASAAAAPAVELSACTEIALPSPGEHAGPDAPEAPGLEFIDGYLAGLAAVNAALINAPADAFYYSFERLGDVSEPRDRALARAFGGDTDQIAFDVEQMPDWRRALGSMAARWLGRDLPPGPGRALADEFVELIDAHLAAAPVSALRVAPRAPVGGDGAAPRIGASFDHMLFESRDGRLLLEFAADI